MRKHRFAPLIGVSLGMLAAALAFPISWADPPVHRVILEADSWPTAENTWEGPAIIWIDGVKYEGNLVYAGEGRMNPNSWHGTEVHRYDFDGLGTLELAGNSKTSFEYVTPEHRWHHYTSHVSITAGTGAFAEAQGTLQLGGYTDWHLPPPPAPFSFCGGEGMIVGILLDGAE